MRLLGAELIEVPAAPYRNPNNYVRLSGRLAEQLAKTEPNGAIWANQFDNTVNRQAHIETTAQEIWRDTSDQIDGFVAAVGSGGTLAGTAIGLKERNHNIKIALADLAWRGASRLLYDRRIEGRRRFDHRRHRAGAHHRQS